MRICIVGKYPPLQGGTSVQTLWLSYWLSRAGHDVSVVTVGAVEDPECVSFRPDEWERLAERFPEMRRVRIAALADDGTDGRSIPATDAYVTRLASAVIDELDVHGAELVIASYLEPFGVAAMLAARSRGVPYVLIPAGSDLHRLGRLASRRSAYAAVVESAAAVITTRRAARDVLALGARADALIFDRPVLTPRSLFSEPASALTPRSLFSQPAPALAPDALPAAAGRPLTDGPVVGMYGKLGRSKGTFELLAAAARLRDEGVGFSLRLMTAVGGSSWAEAARAADRLGLEEIVTWIPFLPHWRVPEFLAGCDCVCFLENRFSVAAHRPQVPREVATAGRCLVLSAEVAGHDLTAEPLHDGENVLLVEDPGDVDELTAVMRRVLADASLRERVARNGRELYLWPTEEACLRWIRQLVAICEDLGETQRGLRLSLESFQNTLLRIYADPGYRARLVRDPGGVDGVPDVSEAERDSLRQLLEEPEALVRYCRSLMNKKFGQLERPFADALSAFPAARDAAQARFHETWVLRDADEIEQLREFERLLLDTGATVLEPAPAGGFDEWIRYLGMRARARVRALSVDEPGGISAPFSRDARVALGAGVEFERFNGRAVRDKWQHDAGPWHVVAVSDPALSDARVLELSPTVWNALRTLTEPVAGAELLARLVGERGVEDAAETALTRLAQLGVVTCTEPNPARQAGGDRAGAQPGA